MILESLLGTFAGSIWYLSLSTCMLTGLANINIYDYELKAKTDWLLLFCIGQHHYYKSICDFSLIYFILSSVFLVEFSVELLY